MDSSCLNKKTLINAVEPGIINSCVGVHVAFKLPVPVYVMAINNIIDKVEIIFDLLYIIRIKYQLF